MEQANKKIDVCNRSLHLARHHKDCGNYFRSFAHYLVHKNVMWELTETESKEVTNADIEEINSVFEKVNTHLKEKLNSPHDNECLIQWKSINDQFFEVLKRTLMESTSFSEAVNEEQDILIKILIHHSTEYASGLFKTGEYLDACDVLDSLLSLPGLASGPRSLSVKEIKDRISNAAVDRWHFHMLNDNQRNEKFMQAISTIIKSASQEEPLEILDIGAGTGLLSLYARDVARRESITASITACEASKPMARIAEKILNINKAASEGAEPNAIDEREIRLIQKLSTHITQDEIKRNSINLLITETFDAGLLG